MSCNFHWWKNENFPLTGFLSNSCIILTEFLLQSNFYRIVTAVLRRSYKKKSYWVRPYYDVLLKAATWLCMCEVSQARSRFRLNSYTRSIRVCALRNVCVQQLMTTQASQLLCLVVALDRSHRVQLSHVTTWRLHPIGIWFKSAVRVRIWDDLTSIDLRLAAAHRRLATTHLDSRRNFYSQHIEFVSHTFEWCEKWLNCLLFAIWLFDFSCFFRQSNARKNV